MEEHSLHFNKYNIIKTLIDQTPIAYIILGEEYRVHYINKSFLELRNLDAERVLGEKCYNISNGGVPCNQCAVRHTLENEEEKYLLRKDVLKDGKIRYLDDYAIPLKTKTKDKKFVLEIMVNRTDEYNARAELWAKYEQILKYLLNLIEIKDDYTAGHSQNVQEVSLQIGRYLELSEEDLFVLSLSAILHDIGKVKIPMRILTKQGKLTDEEYEIMKKHPVYSNELLENLDSFKEIRTYAMYHHERPDGKGYPHGLKGDEIPVFSSIIAVADAYDAMISKRSYKQSLSEEYALSEIERCMGTQFEENIAKAFLEYKRQEHSHICTIEPFVERCLDVEMEPSSNFDIDSLDSFIDFDLFEQIWNETPCAYVLINEWNEVILANQQAYELFDIEASPSEFQDKVEFSQILDMSRMSIDANLIKNSMDKNTVQFNNFSYKLDREVRYIQGWAIPYTEIDGTKYVIVALLDRTKEEKMKQQLKTDFNNLTDTLTEIIDTMYKDISTFDQYFDFNEMKAIKDKFIALKASLNF